MKSALPRHLEAPYVRLAMILLLNQDRMEFRSINDAWLESGILAVTDDLKVVPKLHEIISRKLRIRECQFT